MTCSNTFLQPEILNETHLPELLISATTLYAKSTSCLLYDNARKPPHIEKLSYFKHSAFDHF
jgi:hypothetical protein